MSYDVIMHKSNYRIAEIILNNIKVRQACAQPLKNAPKEVEILKIAFFDIGRTINDVFPEVYKDELIVYLFDRSEGIRTRCGGMCSRFKDGTYSIGICESSLFYDERLKYFLLHEITHLRYFEHSERFYETLDALADIYNLRTGEHIEDKYEDRETVIRKYEAKQKKVRSKNESKE